MKRSKNIPPTHPGQLLRDVTLPEINHSKTEVARLLGISRQTLYDLLNEKQAVTADMAVRLGKLFGNGPQFWLNLQKNHDLHLAEQSVDTSEIPTLELQ